MSSLPNNLNNIIDNYRSSRNYIQNLSQINPLLKTQVLAEEIKNIDTNWIIQFKLATQLSSHLIQTNAWKIYKLRSNTFINSKPDPKFLIGVFFDFLDLYTYEQIIEMIDQLISIKNVVFGTADFYNFTRHLEYSISSRELSIIAILRDEKHISDILSFKIDDKTILENSYNNMIRTEDSVYTTIPLINYIDLFKHYLKLEVKKKDRNKEDRNKEDLEDEEEDNEDSDDREETDRYYEQMAYTRH